MYHETYRAYNELIDRWEYFSICASFSAYEITSMSNRKTFKSDKTLMENLNLAYEKLKEIVEKNNLTKLTKIDDIGH